MREKADPRAAANVAAAENREGSARLAGVHGGEEGEEVWDGVEPWSVYDQRVQVRRAYQQGRSDQRDESYRVEDRGSGKGSEGSERSERSDGLEGAKAGPSGKKSKRHYREWWLRGYAQALAHREGGPWSGNMERAEQAWRIEEQVATEVSGGNVAEE